MNKMFLRLALIAALVAACSPTPANAFTGQPDRCTYGGKTWRVSQTDGSGNNVWQPGVFGWTEVVGA